MVTKFFVAVIFSNFLAISAWAEASSPSLIATPPQPQWRELTVEQKVVLAPLSDDWDSLEYYRQKKWLNIAARFSGMTPVEQRRVQEQMQTWRKLTPEQQQRARDNFKTANQLPTEKKLELKQKWEEYSSLPKEEKDKLKQQAVSNKGGKLTLPLTVAPSFPKPVVMATPVPTTSALPATETIQPAATPIPDATQKP